MNGSVKQYGRLVGLCSLLVAAVLPAQGQMIPRRQAVARPLASNVIIPQRRAFVVRNGVATQIMRVDAAVEILEQMATTTLDVSLQNPSPQRVEAELIVPVPDGAVVRGITFQGGGAEPTAQLLPREEARRIYDSIVNQVKDPALLEFIGYNLIRSSVFPIEAGGKQKVRLTYEHLLEADGDRIDYVLPRSESIDYHVPWHVTVSIRSKRAISTAYSPSHEIDMSRLSERSVRVAISQGARTEPGPFRMSYLLERNGVTASMFSYPDPSVGGGYFLLLAGLPAKAQTPEAATAIKREVTLVIDRSGSMNGQKLEQVRQAALQILAGLEDGEAFNVIVYNESVEMFSPRPVLKNAETIAAARRYLLGVKARGGTNIHDALLEALRLRPMDGALPIVLFLTDGLPTVGQTSERVIRNLATEANAHRRRIFTFGVGVDVNSPLLENIAYTTRATATFVLPNEDVEVKVASVFKRLTGPVLADPTLRVVDSGGADAMGRVRDMLPARLPDLFEDDQLVLLGQYVGEAPVTFKLAGNYLGKPRKFTFKFDFDRATTRNGFVPRLWASRKIGVLIDAIRSSGADYNPVSNAAVDPKIKELVDEIVRLSTEFGILTEYTAFLAREGTNLQDTLANIDRARDNLIQRGVRVRSGLAGINQESNQRFFKGQRHLNMGNIFYDAKMQRVSIANVQQSNDRALFQKSGQWMDSRLASKPQSRPDEIIQFGSKQHLALARRLASRGRAGTISLPGDILMEVDGKTVLIKAPTDN